MPEVRLAGCLYTFNWNKGEHASCSHPPHTVLQTGLFLPWLRSSLSLPSGPCDIWDHPGGAACTTCGDFCCPGCGLKPSTVQPPVTELVIPFLQSLGNGTPGVIPYKTASRLLGLGVWQRLATAKSVAPEPKRGVGSVCGVPHSQFFSGIR